MNGATRARTLALYFALQCALELDLDDVADLGLFFLEEEFFHRHPTFDLQADVQDQLVTVDRDDSGRDGGANTDTAECGGRLPGSGHECLDNVGHGRSGSWRGALGCRGRSIRLHRSAAGRGIVRPVSRRSESRKTRDGIVGC